MKLCDYGCGKEAKYYFKRVNKWCCSEFSNSCPAIRRKNSDAHRGKNHHLFGKKHTPETIKKMKEAKKNISEQTKRKISEVKRGVKTGPFSKETRKKMSKTRRITIEKIKEKYPLFSQIEEMRYNPDKHREKEIQVHCKNHNCPNSKEQGGWFTPVKSQLFHRIRSIENPRGYGESNFYCSDECKNSCILFRARNDPLKNINKTYTQEEYQQFREFVLTRDNYECQYCGDSATIIHHERPQKLEPFFALDPDLAWSVCEKCHYKYGHKAGTECSTGNLANRIC